MKKNVGTIDRVIRLILAIVLGGLFYTGVLQGTLGIILVVLAGVFAVTSFISFCPLYAIFGMTTCPTETKS